MSSIPTSELNNAECEKGHVTQRPPIPYATSKAETTTKASRETVKVRTPEGEVKVALLGDSPGAEEYLQHLNVFLRMLARKKYEDDLLKLSKAVATATALAKKLARVPSGEKDPETAKRLSLWEAAEEALVKAEANETTKVGLVYELFRKGLKEDPELQWDRIVEDMHTKDPWEDLKGGKHDGLRRKSCASLWECIDFHKLRVYSIDAAERQRFYMLCNLKKPAKSSIRAHVTRMETLNKYLGLLPTIKNCPQAVASTELGNVPFNETTLASIILNHLPVAWRIQYALTHTLVPESPRAILLDLENIEKLFAEKTNEAARANKAKVATALKVAGEHVPRKGKRAGGGTKKGTPKKGRTAKYCKWCKAVDGPFTTHNTDECRRFNKDGSQKDRLTKPFDSSKKPAWKKPSGGESSQMAYLTEEMTKMSKLMKKLKKSKKHGKKRARDSSDSSDSDSD
jgi:hypothetical protein